MNRKNSFGSAVLITVFLLMSSFSTTVPVKKFKPEGTWKYSAPAAPEGYTIGFFIIEKGESGYEVTFMLDEYSKVKANEVNYKRRNLEFVLYLENELVRITGTFEDDKFTGKASYSEGVIDITAVREET
ncbi:MAG: hypothetical protein JSV24_05955 [Bacteroidales bacterium]|nr:MAG: hypothetical protein JSV24_05955 [Bacteroidales bacterium]